MIHLNFVTVKYNKKIGSSKLPTCNCRGFDGLLPGGYPPCFWFQRSDDSRLLCKLTWLYGFSSTPIGVDGYCIVITPYFVRGVTKFNHFVVERICLVVRPQKYQ